MYSGCMLLLERHSCNLVFLYMPSFFFLVYAGFRNLVKHLIYLHPWLLPERHSWKLTFPSVHLFSIKIFLHVEVIRTDINQFRSAQEISKIYKPIVKLCSTLKCLGISNFEMYGTCVVALGPWCQHHL